MMLGYVGDAAPAPHWWPTGDLGELDARRLPARSRPEEARAHHRLRPQRLARMGRDGAARASGAVPGRRLRRRCAGTCPRSLWPTRRNATRHRARGRGAPMPTRRCPITRASAHWVRALRPFTPDAGTATANGRPLRAAILRTPRGRSCRRPTEGPTMSFYDELEVETAQPTRAALVAAPIIQGTLRGEVSLPSYVAFLTEAYHHVRHTVPLLVACRERLPARLALDATGARRVRRGGDRPRRVDPRRHRRVRRRRGRRAQRRSRPPATELMVAYAYDTIAARQPGRLLRHGARARGHERRAGAAGGRSHPGDARAARRRRSPTCARTACSTRSTRSTSPAAE